jgi:hypothetical protein
VEYHDEGQSQPTPRASDPPSVSLHIGSGSGGVHRFGSEAIKRTAWSSEIGSALMRTDDVPTDSLRGGLASGAASTRPMALRAGRGGMPVPQVGGSGPLKWRSAPRRLLGSDRYGRVGEMTLNDRHVPRTTVAGDSPAAHVRGSRAWRAGDCDHEVSIPIVAAGAVGRYRGEHPRAKVSMMIMRPPQQGHGCKSVCGSPASVVSAAVGCG